MKQKLSAATLFAILSAATAFAQTSDEELLKQLANPVASLISVPFQSNWDFGMGPSDKGTQFRGAIGARHFALHQGRGWFPRSRRWWNSPPLAEALRGFALGSDPLVKDPAQRVKDDGFFQKVIHASLFAAFPVEVHDAGG